MSNEKGIWNDELKCFWVAFHIFDERTCALFLADGSCDMTGAIAFVTRLMPECKVIQTYSARKRDTRYTRDTEGKWHASPPPNPESVVKKSLPAIKNIQYAARVPLPAYCEPYLRKSLLNQTVIHLAKAVPFAKILCGSSGTTYDVSDIDEFPRTLCGKCDDVAKQEICPDCRRRKARSADDCAAGYCSKWYAVRDREAQNDCDREAALASQ